MRRRLVDFVLLLLGCTLIGAGWYTLTFFEATTHAVLSYLGPAGRAYLCALNAYVPCGVVPGYVLLTLGALLVAVPLGVPATPEIPETAPHTILPPHTGRWVRALLSTAVGLALLGSVLSIRTQLGTWPLLLWLATFLLPIPAMASLDRARGTRFGNPFPERWEWALLLLIVALALGLVGHDMTHWRWAGTPDEADFFGVAKSIATGTSQRPLLSEVGVFMFQPVLSSLYPALFMLVFGVNAFAWKLSSVMALVGSLPFVYVFTRELWNRRTAFMAIVFFGSAQLAVGFSHFGYNNVQVYPILAGGLGVLAWARTRQSLLGYYLAGCIAGVGFYTYYTARAVAPLLLLLMWSSDGWPLARKNRVATAALAGGLTLAILPIFSDIGVTLRNMLRLAFSGDQAGTVVDAVARILSHWLLSLTHGLWFPGPHHFQSNPVVDPISGTLALIGFWLCIRGWRHTNGRFLAPAYVLAAFLVGATSQHPRPPLTRLLFLAPLTGLLAAVGGAQLLRALQGTGHVRRLVARGAVGALVAASVVWNIAVLQYSVRSKHHGHGRGTTSELIRMGQELPAHHRIIFIQARESAEGMVEFIMDEYGMRDRLTYRAAVDAPALELLRTIAPPFVLFTDIDSPEAMAKIEATMALRFPAGAWGASDPGQRWSLRYFDVAGAGSLPGDLR